MYKVGIITFHRAVNYGAMLQAVALQKAINAQGYDAELIDYVDKLYDHYKISYRTSNPAKSIIKFLLSRDARKRNKRFREFLMENAAVSKMQFNRESIAHIDEDSYMAFFSGSDQTFNPIIVDYDENYVLGFVKDKSKCNAYAASIGLAELNDREKEWLKCNVKQYHSILVREQTGIDLLAQIGILDTTLVCDPTFLLSADEWRKMQIKTKVPNHYILYFGFKKSGAMENKAKEISQRTGYPIFTISEIIKNDERGYQKFSGAGPAEWLYLIEHADYIVTNSFHGMIFSFIFHKQVWIADSDDGTFSRMEDFLTKMNCSHRILGRNALEIEDRLIQYEEVAPLMQAYITESKKILNETLKEYEMRTYE